MVAWDMPRTASGARVMVELGRDHGVPVDAALRGSGIASALLSDQRTRITARQEFTVAANVVAAVDDVDGLGVEAGLRFDLMSYGAFAFAVVSSPTVGSAVDLMLGSVGLTFAFSTIGRRTTAGRTKYVFSADDVPEEMRRFVIERDVAGVRCLQREIFSTPPPLQIALAFPAPDAISKYAAAFGVRPRFDAPESSIAADEGLLNLPMPQSNPQILELALAQCHALLDHRRERTGTSRQVRDLLAADLVEPPDARSVADRLNLADRTLRQRLASEGTTFRALLEEVREGFAEEFLANGLPVAEVARRLGYREVSSFSQAFRRWKGVSPRAYRTMTASTG